MTDNDEFEENTGEYKPYEEEKNENTTNIS